MFPAKTILCPTDFSEASLQALANASDIAVHNGAEVYLIHVIPNLLANAEPAAAMTLPEYEQFLQPQQRLKQAAEPLIARGIKVQTVLGHGDAASEIVRIAKEKRADLIVIATHGNTGWRHFAFGSVAEKVVRLAFCPVLSIRSAASGASGDPS
jgi:nucleotide-binding universal stress UspA family protein